MPTGDSLSVFLGLLFFAGGTAVAAYATTDTKSRNLWLAAAAISALAVAWLLFNARLDLEPQRLLALLVTLAPMLTIILVWTLLADRGGRPSPEITKLLEETDAARQRWENQAEPLSRKTVEEIVRNELDKGAESKLKRDLRLKRLADYVASLAKEDAYRRASELIEGYAQMCEREKNGDYVHGPSMTHDQESIMQYLRALGAREDQLKGVRVDEMKALLKKLKPGEPQPAEALGAYQ